MLRHASVTSQDLTPFVEERQKPWRHRECAIFCPFECFQYELPLPFEMRTCTHGTIHGLGVL